MLGVKSVSFDHSVSWSVCNNFNRISQIFCQHAEITVIILSVKSVCPDQPISLSIRNHVNNIAIKFRQH